MTITVTAANVRALEGAIVRRYAAGGTLDMGDLVYLDSNGAVQVTDANAAATSAAFGIIVAGSDVAESQFESGDAVAVCVFGPVGGFAGMTPGALQYVSETAGEFTETAPTGAGTWTKVAGRAESASVFFVNPGVSAAASNS